uniref:Companion of reaper protein n=1 Tax=Drosophila melanogaster TaxID=7227 RepID=Q9W3G9_DROME|eukprot:NP_001245578.1 companion of reaper, isoform B [Drosophila melanogaster]
MADIRSSLKVLFQGETNLITCGSSNTYEEVISQAMTRFAIPETQRKALILTNGKDYVFEAHLLEYFLLLFPCPEITFHLRFDWSKMRRSLGQTESLKRKRLVDLEQAEGQKEEDQEKEDPVPEYKPVPVYRMNCFLGSLPTAGAIPVHRQNCFLREQSQQQLDEISIPRLQEDDDQKEPPKKRQRVDVCSKPRRTASTSVGPSPVPVMRSIRI